jgi:methyl-accepting chemotaxis protein
MWFKKLTLRSKILIGGISPLFLLLFTGIMSMVSFNAILDSVKWIHFTNEVVQDTILVLNSAVDMETGMRGYLLSGNSHFLEPYHDGEKNAFEKISSLKKSVSHHTEQFKRLEKMENTLKSWQNNVFEPAVSLRKQVGDTKTMEDIVKFVNEERGKQYFDKFRKLVNVFVLEEEKLMNEREAANVAEVSRTDTIIVFCMVISVFLVMCLSLFITKSVLKQLGCDPSILSDFAIKIATGDLTERLNTSEDKSVATCFDQVADALENVLNEYSIIVDNISKGSLTFRGDPSKFQGAYKKLLIGANNVSEIAMGILDSIVIPILIINNDFDIIFVNKEGCQLLGKSTNEMINHKCYDVFKTKDCRTSNCACSQAMNTGQKISSETIATINNKSLDVDYYGVPLKSTDGSIVGAFEFIIDQTDIRQSKKYQEVEVNMLSSILKEVADGDLTLRYIPSKQEGISEAYYNNFINISNALNATISKIQKINDYQKVEVSNLSAMLQKIAGGDLTQIYVPEKADDDTIDVHKNFSDISNAVNTTVRKIEKVNDYQKVEVDNLSAMLQKIADGDMKQVYVPQKADDDTIDVHKNFLNISNAINATVGKIAKVNTYQHKEVINLTAMLELVSRGDITQKYSVSESDNDTLEAYNTFKAIADALNTTFSDLSQIIKTVKDYAENVATSSEDLSSASTSLSESADHMSAKTTSVAASVEQMSNNISSMASATEEISVSANEVSSTTEQMSQSMSNIAAAVEESSMSINEIGKAAKEGAEVSINATSMANEATSVMNSLGEAAKEIGEVTEVIKRIADQTNLLALNATIEAASAGDAGRGFAVVANEIKKLANQSAQAAENISKRIEGVQNNTIDAIKTIDQVTGIIKKINDSVSLISSSVNDQTSVSTDIAANIAQVTNGAKQISLLIQEVANGLVDMSKNSSEVAYGTNDVSSNVQIVEKSVNESNDNIKKVSVSANKLTEIAKQLRELVSTFNV